MAFDVVSFGVGLAAGALTGLLAGYLHETETIGELQERVRMAMLQFERLVSNSAAEESMDPRSVELHRMLSQIQDDIKRLYKKSSR